MKRVALVACGLVGCTGDIGVPAPQPTPPFETPSHASAGPAGDGRAPTGGMSAAPAIEAGTPGPSGLRRLTLDEYRASVRDVLGIEPALSQPLEPDLIVDSFTGIGAAASTVSARGVERFEAAALELARRVFADPGRRAVLVACSPAVISDPCVEAFVARVGRHAWRRPLTIAERERYRKLAVSVASDSKDVWLGLEHAVAGMLQSPHFLYRVELGQPDPRRPGLSRFTDLELATRLSYLVTGSTPDLALLDAAERGELATADGLQGQLKRLLAGSRTRGALTRFFVEWLGLGELDHLDKDTKVFPLATPALAAAMRGELERMTADLALDRDGDLLELLDTRNTFVNGDLARLYKLAAPAASAWAKATHPMDGARAGITGTAAILALHSTNTRTSPTLRGRFIRERLLCQDIPIPPADVNTALPEPTGGRQTMRQRLELHAKSPACAGCHAAMDPLGLALERFDGIGAYRETDGGLALDLSGNLDGAAFKDARELATQLRAHPAAAPCVAREIFRFAMGRHESPGEAGWVKQWVRDARGSVRLLALLADVVGSDSFRFSSGPR